MSVSNNLVVEVTDLSNDVDIVDQSSGSDVFLALGFKTLQDFFSSFNDVLADDEVFSLKGIGVKGSKLLGEILSLISTEDSFL